MAGITNLYVQSIDAPLPPQDIDDAAGFKSKIDSLWELIDSVDAIIVGIGSGMSTASGYDFYHPNPLVDEEFAEFERDHGFETLFDGLYHVFPGYEEQWAFYARVADWLSKLPVGSPYRKLAKLLEGKEHFVITSNIDGQVPRAFGDDRTFCFQGDLRYCQCSQPCDEETRVIAEVVKGASGHAERGIRIATDDLPRCSKCGHILAPWVRDENFLEGDVWKQQERRYVSFLRAHLVDRADKVLFLELGVSSMTPGIIKMPFWDMCARNKQTTYVCVNVLETAAPQHLGQRAMVITADIESVMAALSLPRELSTAVF